MNDKVILITGASGGLGKALCLRFGKAGGKLAALDVDEKGLDTLAVELQKAEIRHLTQVCDITSPASVNAAVSEVEAALGPIDILINNAGITHLGTAQNTPLDAYRKLMEVNFMGAVICTQAALPSLIEQRGVVVAISSVAGFAPLVGRTAYGASKHAMNGYFATLRSELKRKGVAVLVVCPASIDTPIRQRFMGADEGDHLMQHTTGRSNTPEEVAEMIFRAVKKRKRLLVTGFTGKASWWLMKLWPRLYEQQMLKRMGPAIWEMEEN